MKDENLGIASAVLSKEWSEFKFNKNKRTWVKESRDRVLVMVQCQKSQWGEMYYLNYGVYFIDAEPTDKSLRNLPKTHEWHLIARYESLAGISQDEQNRLFSLAASDVDSLVERSDMIASFSKKNILPMLDNFGDLTHMSIEFKSRKFGVFAPYRIQKISDDLIEKLLGLSE